MRWQSYALARIQHIKGNANLACSCTEDGGWVIEDEFHKEAHL